MKKKYLEIITAVGSVAILIILIILVSVSTSSTGYGYTAALMIFVILMGIAGLKLAEIPDK